MIKILDETTRRPLGQLGAWMLCVGLLLGCDGIYLVVVERQSLVTRDCPDTIVNYTFTQHKFSGVSRWSGRIELSKVDALIPVSSGATGGRPDRVRLLVTCPSNGQTVFDSGQVGDDDVLCNHDGISLLYFLSPEVNRELCPACKTKEGHCWPHMRGIEAGEPQSVETEDW